MTGTHRRQNHQLFCPVGQAGLVNQTVTKLQN